MQTMPEREGQKRLSGRVIANDAYIGGFKVDSKLRRAAKKAGILMTAVEVDENSAVRNVRFD